MPRLKTAAAAPPPPLAGLPASGSSSELQVRQGKLYLVRVGQPPIIRVATAVKVSRHPFSGRQQVYVSFPGRDKRHDVSLDIGAFVELYNPTTVRLDAEGMLVGRTQPDQVVTDRDGDGEAQLADGEGGGDAGLLGSHGNAAVLGVTAAENETPEVKINGPPLSPSTSKRRRLNKHGAATPASDLLDPTSAGVLNALHKPPSRMNTPDKEHEALTRVRNFDHVRFGRYLIKTWYYSPYVFPLNDPPAVAPPSLGPSAITLIAGSPVAVPGKKRGRDSLPSTSRAHPAGPSHLAQPVEKPTSHLLGGVGGKKGGGTAGSGDRRLFVCYKCFKYFRELQLSRDHDAACTLLIPPGRQVYQRPDSQFTIWEVDGAAVPNLSLFGKLFIDHKSLFFLVENFLFYIACITTTSTHQQPVAFFSKEKFSYDDYNLACIVTFPPWQKTHKLGRLLIEFSYLLTRHPATRSATNPSPGTPERPISDLGMKGYAAYWRSTVLRYLRTAYRSLEAAAASAAVTSNGSTGAAIPADKTGGVSSAVTKAKDEVAGESTDTDKRAVLRMTIKDLARAVHLTEDDTAWTMQQLALVKRRERRVPPTLKAGGVTNGDGTVYAPAEGAAAKVDLVNGGEMLSRDGASGPQDNGERTENRQTSASANGHNGATSSASDNHMPLGGVVSGNEVELHDEQGEDEEEEEDDEDEGDPAAHHRHWVFDMSKARIEELCVRYKVTEAPLLLESAVRL